MDATGDAKDAVEHPKVVTTALASIRERLDQFEVRPLIEHVRGHCGHPLNEAADGLARNARMANSAELPFALDLVSRACTDYADLRRASSPDAVTTPVVARVPRARVRQRVEKALELLDNAR